MCCNKSENVPGEMGCDDVKPGNGHSGGGGGGAKGSTLFMCLDWLSLRH